MDSRITNQPRLAIVVPCYKEEAVLPETTKRLGEVLQQMIDAGIIASNSYVLYVNDGSTDATWPMISAFHKQYKYVCGVNLAGNVGHQNALIAGLSTACSHADVLVSIDADLQDDVKVIEKMVGQYLQGYDIVYGVRQSRTTDTWFKRTTALGFYSLMKLMGVKSVYNHADFRLMSRRAVEFLLRFEERNLFLRGMVPLVGYKTANVYYDRAERFAGESKYPLRKMIAFAFDGITSFSVKPVHLVLYMGIIFLIVSLCILAWVLEEYITGNVVPGWSSLMVSLWFCTGCILTGLGIVGEYIGKVYTEVKRRPRFNVESVLLHED
ncbi:MAG: glycosyltransferase family 2 protein [Agathobacter sp.]